MKKLKIFLLISLFVLPIVVFGADINLVKINPNIPPGTSANDPGGIVASFYQFALIFSGVLAFAVIVYAGIRYTLAAGNPSGQSDAKQWIYSALIGLLLLAGGGIILNIVNEDIFKFDNGTLVVPGIDSLKKVEKTDSSNDQSTNPADTGQPEDNPNPDPVRSCIGVRNGTKCMTEQCAPLGGECSNSMCNCI
jgi:hypothetical protein